MAIKGKWNWKVTVGGAAFVTAVGLAVLHESMFTPAPKYAPTPVEYNQQRAARGLAPAYFPGDTIDGVDVPEGYLVLIDQHKGVEPDCTARRGAFCQEQHGTAVWHYSACLQGTGIVDLPCDYFKERYK